MGANHARDGQIGPILQIASSLRNSNAATLAASWAVKDADAETKRKMDLVTGGTYLGLGACMTQFDADTDFGEKFGKPMKFVNIASQLTIGGLFIKRAMDAKK